MKMTPLNSWIDKIGFVFTSGSHRQGRGNLVLAYASGGKSEYKNVPFEIYLSLLIDSSPGKVWHKYIKGKY